MPPYVPLPLPKNESFAHAWLEPDPDPPPGRLLFEGYYKIAKDDFEEVQVWGHKSKRDYVFCVEKVHAKRENDFITYDRKWYTEADYVALHDQLWNDALLRPHESFNIGRGLDRFTRGRRSYGGSELCDSHGNMNMDVVRYRCS